MEEEWIEWEDNQAGTTLKGLVQGRCKSQNAGDWRQEAHTMSPVLCYMLTQLHYFSEGSEEGPRCNECAGMVGMHPPPFPKHSVKHI